MVADTAVAPAALTQRGDKLWVDFRRTTSFDHQYCGNPPMKLSDKSLEDIYALLDVTCPPRSFFGPLRGVGARFLEQDVNFTATDEMVLDDITDYIYRAMPDVLLERAIDMCTLLSRPSKTGYGDADAMEMFYAMVDDYVPEDNFFLAEGSSGRRLMSEAALRELHQVDPIYFDAEEDHEITQYDAIGGDDDEYAFADGESPDPTYDIGNGAVDGPTYDIGAGNELTYDIGNDAGNEPTYDIGAGNEPTYDIGNDTRNEPTYDLGAQGATTAEEDIYGIASASEPSTAAGERLYGLGNKMADEAPIYGMESNALGSQPDDAETYGLATATKNRHAQAVYDNNAGVSPTKAPDPAIYDNNAGLDSAAAIRPVSASVEASVPKGPGRAPPNLRNSSYVHSVAADQAAGPSFRSASYNEVLATEEPILESPAQMEENFGSLDSLEIFRHHSPGVGRSDTITSMDFENMAEDFAEMEADGLDDMIDGSMSSANFEAVAANLVAMEGDDAPQPEGSGYIKLESSASA